MLATRRGQNRRVYDGGIGSAQLVYSTFLGGVSSEFANSLAVDDGGVVTVAGGTHSGDFATTIDAFDTTPNGSAEVFVSRLSMGIAFYADRFELSLKQAGTQKLWIDAGKVHANRSYAIFGSMTGTSPGVTLLGIHSNRDRLAAC